MTSTQRFTLTATGLGLFMIYLDALIVNVALPAIQSDFRVGEAGLQWVVTAYSLGMTIAIMSSGTVADIYGRRKLYLVAITFFTVASAAGGLASSVGALNLARGVQGVTDGNPRRSPRRRTSGSDRAQGSRCDHIKNANPRAYAAVIGPGRPIQHLDPATQKAILVAADSDFLEAIRFSLVTAMVLLSLVMAAGFAWFPRGKGPTADAEEVKALALE